MGIRGDEVALDRGASAAPVAVSASHQPLPPLFFNPCSPGLSLPYLAAAVSTGRARDGHDRHAHRADTVSFRLHQLASSAAMGLCLGVSSSGYGGSCAWQSVTRHGTRAPPDSSSPYPPDAVAFG